MLPQGETPDNMRRFWRALLRKSLPPSTLAGLAYAVFGLGDSGYVQYNVRHNAASTVTTLHITVFLPSHSARPCC